MKRFPFALATLLFFCITMLSSCQAIADIFGAGFKVGIGLSVIVVKALGAKK